MIVTNKALSRRTVLRGMGAALALPMLDGMVPAFASSGRPPLRFGSVYVPNGMWMQNFTPQIEGPDFELTPILEPLRAFRKDFVVVSGLAQQEAYSWPGEGIGDHSRGLTSFLTGLHAKKTESNPELLSKSGKAHASFDQILAAKYATETQIPSLELGIDGGETVGSCDPGYACAFLRTISWRSSRAPNPTENNPRAVFERLFGATGTTDPAVRQARMAADRSLLDSVMDKITGLRRRLSAADTVKLNDYLEAVRAIERRIQMAEQQSGRELPVVDQPLGIPDTFEEHIKLLYDLQALAFQTDLTRVFTLVVAHEVSGRSYPEIGAPENHHSLSHNVVDPAAIAMQTKINAYHLGLFANFLEKLRQMPEGDGTVLDHSAFVYGSGISVGNVHSHHDLPLVVVGSCGGRIRGGRHLRYPKDTPAANLFATLLGKYGLPAEQFGDSNGELRELSEV